ncbi:MAG: chemotaxis protein CheW [Pseudomonadales bacterium]|jgi:chemotaxis signal transduction protein|nr:chemotaxis protein CheW [Pseudomonadales bacterium]
MNTQREIPCVLVPIETGQLLLPNVTVAEVLRMQRIRPLKGAPRWQLGILPWRGRAVPVLSVELLLEDAGYELPPPSANHALLVMNRTRPLDALSFYAVRVAGAPRLLWIAEEDLDPVDGLLGPAEAARIRLGEEAALVPKLAYLEDLVLRDALVQRPAPQSA